MVGGCAAPARDGRAPRRGRSSAASSAFTAGSIRAGACACAALQPAHARPPAPAPASASLPPPHGRRADRPPPSRACIMAVRRSASAVSSPRSGASRCEFVDRVAQPLGLALRALDLGAMRRHLALAPRAAPPTVVRPRAASRVEAAKGVEQAAVGRGVHQRALVVLAVDLDQRARPAPAAPARSTGWSLTKARVRPSASCTRRRMSSSSAGMSLAARIARAG